jgi:hypothetical protein
MIRVNTVAIYPLTAPAPCFRRPHFISKVSRHHPYPAARSAGLPARRG